ncbi:MAG TPA: hypothetical protein VD969_14285 [Symbiobacteriaceae bacterium]|nr:hypothetical protein [Symbiobacteriaceae bacterium]
MGLMKKLTSALVASSLVLSLVATASAAYTPAAGETAGKRMQDLKIVQGRPDGLALNSEITRAELVTLIVRAFGKEADAQLLKGSTVFPDIANHWASGNIAMAVALVEKAGSDPIGMPNGTFEPDAKLTPAQAVAFLMKFVGAKADGTKTWPANYLDVAVEKNLITAEDKALIAPMLNENATRGLVFYLFDRAFFSYQLPTGKTFYTQYVDTAAPELTVAAVEPTTIDSKLTITGTVTGALETYVGTTKVTPAADGKFSAEFALPELKDYEITVTALDLAGNKAEKSLKVTRVAGTAASIEASDITVAAGGTVEVKPVVKDAAGNVLEQAVTGESAVGTYADGKFTAQATVGTGKLVLKAGELTKEVSVTINAGPIAKVEASAVSVAPGKSVTLVAKDAAGNVVSGVTFAQTSANALLDANTGVFIATKAGSYTVTATKDGVTVEGTVGVYGDISKLVVNAPANMIANDATEYDVTVTAVDSKGNAVLDFDGNIKLTAFGADETKAAEDGVATFTVTVPEGYADSEVDIYAQYDDTEDDAIDSDDEEYTDTVAVEAQVATSIEVDAPDYLVSDIDDEGDLLSAPFTITVLDQDGEDMLDGAWEIEVTVTGDATLEEGDDTKSDTLTITAGGDNEYDLYAEQKGDEGTVTVTAAFPGMTAGKDTLKMAMPKNPEAITLTAKDNKAEVTADFTDVEEDVEDDDVEKVTYTVKVVDENGVPTLYDTTVTITLDGVDKPELLYVATDADLEVFADLEDEEDEFDVSVVDGVAKFALVGQHVDSFKLVAEDGDSDDDYDLKDSAELSLSVVADEAAYVGLTKGVLNYLQKEDATATVTAQLYDAFGNKVAKAGLEVEFDTADFDGIEINGDDEAVTVETDVNGAANATVGLATYIDEAEITISTDEEGLELADGTAFDNGTKAYDSVTLGAVSTIPASVKVEAKRTNGTNTSTIAAGTDFYLKVTVEDNYGRAVDNDDFLAEYGFSLSDSNDDLDLGSSGQNVTFSAGDEDGVFVSTEFYAEDAETLTLTVKVKNIADTVQGSKSISVKAGDVASATVAQKTTSGLDIPEDKESDLLTVQLTDEFGNLITSTSKSYVVVITGADRVEDEDGTDVSGAGEGILVKAGRTTAKFRLFVEDIAADSEISLTVYEADADGAPTGAALGDATDITLK